jgi:D-glycero-alpha-D-manno-heptose 1-phosphate guanylyltransferase
MKDLSNITAVILAGGLGTRLRSVVSDRPKVLAEVHGRPFLTYLLDQLVSVKIKEAVLCTGYMADQVRKTLGEAYGPLRLVYSPEPSPLGTGGALRLALPFFHSDPVLVMNGDSFLETDLQHFWNWYRTNGADAALLLIHMNQTGRYGRVSLDSGDRVLSFSEKDPQGRPGWINGGIYFVRRHLIEAIPEGRPVSLEKEIFPSLIGQNLYGYPSQGRFIDIGTPETYAVKEAFFDGKTRGAKKTVCRAGS